MPKDESGKAYSRGYWRGLNYKWPHGLPDPPSEKVAAVIHAGKAMRDWIDAQRAMGAYEEHDVGSMLDQFDDSVAAIRLWMMETMELPTPEQPDA